MGEDSQCDTFPFENKEATIVNHIVFFSSLIPESMSSNLQGFLSILCICGLPAACFMLYLYSAIPYFVILQYDVNYPF